MKREPKKKRPGMGDWKPWMEPYRHLIGNTGGNPIEELLADTDTNSFNNLYRFVMIVAVNDQVLLLERLRSAGLLNEKAADALISASQEGGAGE